jgi:Ti type entry exclusion protein TrbK
VSRSATIIFGIGAISLTSAATYWFVTPSSDTTAETLEENQRSHREKFFKAPEEKPLVGQEMRPRW